MADDQKKAPFVPVQFLGTYKLPDNSGQRAGIFQELVEGEPVFIMVMDSRVECRSLTKHEIKFVETVQVKEGVTEQEVLEAAAQTMLKVGVAFSWDEKSNRRVMEILGLPPETTVKVETEDE